MTTLAPKLPYSHPFAGGYPRLGGQPLPTDPDAIDYLQRQAAVDGPVEVGVAMAVDAFVKGCKADGIWSAIKASCIMAGARTISGALVPLVGDAPTPNNLVNFDYERSTGIKGVPAGGTYLDTNRSNDADGQDDNHISVYATSVGATNTVYLGEAATNRLLLSSTGNLLAKCNGTVYATVSGGNVAGFMGGVRASSTTQIVRAAGTTAQNTNASIAPSTNNMMVFSRGTSLYSDARLAFYSIGSAIHDLALLDNRVTNLVKGIQFWNYTGLSPHAYDPDTIAYVVAGYAAGGTL